MEPPVSAAPTLESEEAYEEALLALEELTRLVRAHPEVLRALQLRQGAEDRSIMKGLGKFTDLFDVLRAAGCSIPEASRGELLYELACQVRPASRVKRSKRWLWFCAAGLLVSILLGFSLLIVLQVTQATRGYQVGDCIINLFTNSSCQQAPGCFVEVAVRSGELFMVKSAWALPVEHTGPEADFTRYAGDPFRCCNDDQGQVPKCCDLVSGGIQMRTAETFCDSWGTLGKVDWLGQPCNVAAWPCLFSVDPLGENIDELMFFVQPDISGYLVVVIGSFVLLSMLFLVPLIMKYVRCDCDPEPSKEDEEGGELFDPDDPKCDWGAAVQEALQDEYRRRKEMGGCERLKTLLARARELWRLVACRCRRRPSTPRVTQAGRATTRGSLVQDGRWSMRSSTQDLRGSTLRGSHLSQDGLRASTLRGSQMSQDGLRTSTLRGSYLSQDGLRSSLRASHVSQDGARKSMRASQVPWDEPPAPPEPTVVLPPGFIWHGEEEPNAMVKKYQTWEAVDKEVNDFQETDIHPGFQLGNLSGLARLAVHQKENLCAPIVEPIPKAKSYGNTHYSMSSFREGRNKRKKRRPKADAKKLQDRELADKLRFAAKGPAAGMLE